MPIELDDETSKLVMEAASRRGVTVDEYVKFAVNSLARGDLRTHAEYMALADSFPPPAGWLEGDEEELF